MTGWVDGWGLTKKNRLLLEGLLEDVIFEIQGKESLEHQGEKKIVQALRTSSCCWGSRQRVSVAGAQAA